MTTPTVNLEQLCPEKSGLKRDMKSRHLMMISIGGTIGTGLFMGSGQVISQAGPFGAILAFLFGGFVMYLALLCLGELAVAMPVAGSFQSYASRFISPGVGFTVGWLYWINWAVCIAADFTAAGIIMTGWFPQVAVWVWCVIFGVILALLNLISVKVYGETEFWFASIKVAAIVGFIIAGAGLMFGFAGREGAIGFTNFATGDGIFPNGGWAVFLTMVTVVYSFQGSELVGIAAGECENPGENVPRVIKGIALRIVLFYVLAIIVLAATIPFKEAGVLESPFAHVFGRIGIPVAQDIMSFVVLTSALSAGNSALYVCSRLLWSMSKDHQAPGWLSKLNSRGVPFYGVLMTLALAALSLLTSAFAADTVYLWLMSSVGLTGCLIWIVIAWCQINFRKNFLQLGGKLEQLIFKTPFYPIVPAIAVLLNAGIIISLYFDESQQIVLYTGIPVIAFIYLYYLFVHSKKEEKIKEVV
ncbi:amino acid permease [Sporomusa acidovorans]|uniref:Amino-acid permease RocC n=1 Tax=Sporomusa acidovorans (strain ATCC 49682 / DSM 3132 / Mol) TaxID=1123286 RepID=A0ABZ3J9E9_SPOA4|nr:amino acid permease [Sporomusa acidovorans]OZC16093.1 amino-acid permease RocC [Sporomusa acidovorans DSM 3132]SDD86885.1 arginine:proton symporter, AAT family [Sporomusa acidovorans]